MSTDIAKAIKGATKPKEAPPKEKYILAIKRYLQQSTHSSDVLFANVSQQLLSKLNSSSLVVSLKAHIVFHHLLADRSLKKYALFSLIARYYASANRSSVDCTVGAGTSIPSMYFANPPAFPTPSLYYETQSFDSPPQTPQQKHSLQPTRLNKLRTSSSKSFLSNFSSRSDCQQQTENLLETLSNQSSKQNILPNLAHSLPQASDSNRLVSAYNRYLRERVLHYKQLQLDPITEKVYKTSIVDDESYASQDFSNTLLSQIQCVTQQIRLLLACIFTDEALAHPLYHYCYNLVAKDLSILFRFLNIALVIALQNFFTLSTANAERTLFAYKEYTQLQIPEEVMNYVRQAPNAVNTADLAIPQALRQDQKAITALTKSLENYLYEISINEFSSSSISNPVPTRTTVESAKSKEMSESNTRDSLAKKKSSSVLGSSVQYPPTQDGLKNQFINDNESDYNTYSNLSSARQDLYESKLEPPSNGRSLSHNTFNSLPMASSPDVPPPRITDSSSKTSSPVTVHNNNNPDHFSQTISVLKTPDLSSTSDIPPEIPPKKDRRRTFNSNFDSVISKSTSISSSTTQTPAATGTASITEKPQDPILEALEKANDPNLEKWKELFEGLGNSDATFSLKFDIAAALQRSINLYEEQQKFPQELIELKKQAEYSQPEYNSHLHQPQLQPQFKLPGSAGLNNLAPTFSYETNTNPYAVSADYVNHNATGGDSSIGGLGIYHAPPMPAYAHDDVSTINSSTSSAASTYHSSNSQHHYTYGVINDHEEYVATNGYRSSATTSASSNQQHHNATDDSVNQKNTNQPTLKQKASGIMKKFKKVTI